MEERIRVIQRGVPLRGKWRDGRRDGRRDGDGGPRVHWKETNRGTTEGGR